MRISSVNDRSRMNISWALVFFYAVFVIAGVANVYSASYDADFPSVFDISRYGGRQLLFAGMSVVIIVVVMLLDMSLYERMAWIFYIFSIIIRLFYHQFLKYLSQRLIFQHFFFYYFQ